MKFTDMMQLRGIKKTRWLIHVNLFFKMTMEKSITYVQLTSFPTIADSKWQNYANSDGFDDGTKRLSVINSLLLMKSLGN